MFEGSYPCSRPQMIEILLFGHALRCFGKFGCILFGFHFLLKISASAMSLLSGYRGA